MDSKNLDEKLEQISVTLKHLLAIKLYKNGVSQTDIAKHLRFATAKTNKLLKGIKRD